MLFWISRQCVLLGAALVGAAIPVAADPIPRLGSQQL